MSKSIENQIFEIYSLVFNKIFTKERLRALSKGSRLSTVQAVSILQSSEKYDKFAKEFAFELAKKGLAKNRGIWKKYYRAAKKTRYVALPPTYKAYEYKIMSEAVKQNFTMIKSIPEKIIDLMQHKYVSDLIEEIAKGTRPRGSFKKELEKHGHKNAKLIARTETSKLQSSIIEMRAKSIGSVAYVWRASNDKRTRPSHKAMNDVIVFWRSGMEKPFLDNMYGNAGEFPNCRCSPNPIFDEDDLTKSRYNVYDYKTHKIISMSKSDLLSKLQSASLD